ncbi:MAG: hypothetical protein JWO30_328 [Fibrobacteres bacterium]|nr:hypothetical protein [Fibrobacterota bacterium]
MHQLTGNQVGQIVREILDDPILKEKIEIKIPREFVESEGLPEETLTSERTTALRHAPCTKAALLLANTNDDQDQSLKDITRLGASEFKESPNIWVAIASRGLPLLPEMHLHWACALRGLLLAHEVSLEDYANYIKLTAERIRIDSVPLYDALGWALPALRLPRNSGRFVSIKSRDFNNPGAWKRSFGEAFQKLQPLLKKQTSSRQILEPEVLQLQFESVKDQIPSEAHGVVQAFINAGPNWTEQSAALSELEWEQQSICQVFSGIKTEKISLADETIHFFDFAHPKALTEDDSKYLVTLRQRKTKEPHEEDKEFFEKHRNELHDDKPLKSKWDKFIYGKNIECTDFLVGLISALERLYEQAAPFSGKKKLIIRAQRKTKKAWMELNTDLGLFFCLRYRGIEKMTSPFIDWEVSNLFSFDKLINELLQQEAKKRKYPINTSSAKSATQIKFEIELQFSGTQVKRSQVTQLIWMGNPNSIGGQIYDDLDRLSKKPFVRHEVSRQPINKKGQLQSISLEDVSSLDAAFRQDAGSLIGTYHLANDFGKPYLKKIEEAEKQNRLDKDGAYAIKHAWNTFSENYKSALVNWLTNGVQCPEILTQAYAFGALLEILKLHCRGDLNRKDFWEPILQIGNIDIVGGAPAAIIAPWHPLRLASIAVKTRLVAGLFKRILSREDVNFGDSRLFFADLKEELLHPFYPEVSVGRTSGAFQLLIATDTLNDYSLMEMSTRSDMDSATNESPKDSANKIVDLVDRYLTLQPHEQANLSLALYNCDSTGLPIAAVEALAAFKEDEEVRCNIVLKHNDNVKLSHLYSEMLESVDSDPDAAVASENSRDFMAKLRVGILLDAAPKNNSTDGKLVDIVFLQDVVSRRASCSWVSQNFIEVPPNILDHIPPRWSYKRSAAEDELKSSSYIVCPRQPACGLAYLDAVFSLTTNESAPKDSHKLPIRQIAFHDGSINSLFEEVHNLAEWVVNYDTLLDKRLLKNQNINIIRYQRNRSQGRNLLVSSTSQTRVLIALVIRRLTELNLGIPPESIHELAKKLISEAGEVSGDIVMRAAKRGVFAGELLGLVLSKLLVKSEISATQPVIWFSLDEYADWLGQKEEKIADILALSVYERQGETILKIVVTESKYIDTTGASEARRNSSRQLTDTVKRIEDALFGDPGRLDRDLWLYRLSDLISEGIPNGLAANRMFDAIRDKVRLGEVKIDIKGYSHVFVHGPSGSAYPSDQEDLGSTSNCYQEVFDRESVRNLVLNYLKNESISEIRKKLGDKKPWDFEVPKMPAPRVSWVDRQGLSPEDISLGERVQNSNYPNALNPYSIESTQHSLPQKDGGYPIGTDAPSAEDDQPHELKNSGLVEQPEVEDIVLPYSPAVNKLILENSLGLATSPEDFQWLETIGMTLRTALVSYDLQAKILGSRLTPNAAVVRLKGTDRLRTEDIEKKQSQLLTTHALQIISITGVPGEIVVAIARPKRQTISLWDLLKERKINRSDSGINMSFILGVRELDGEQLFLNLSGPFGGSVQHAPHTLIAGATGSGKSVLLQNLVLDICLTNSPRLANIYLIDPKGGIDYPGLEKLPHLKGEVIVDQGKAMEVLEFLVQEMDRRYQLFRGKASNLLEYNSKVGFEGHLPAIWLVHDEFAEWMMIDTYKDAVSVSVQRLGVKARAAGIHLIFAAQRPDANVMPVQLRDNLGNRLVLRVESIGTSEIALGAKGAERLLGKGHLIARLSGEPDFIFSQVPFLSNSDVARIAEALNDSK